MRKKIWLIPIIVFGLLIILNPGMNQFKEYIGVKLPGFPAIDLGDATNNTEYKELLLKSKTQLKRTSNLLFFSVYEKNNEKEIKKYIGILMNFIDISKPAPIIDYSTIDTAKSVMDTAKAAMDIPSSH